MGKSERFRRIARKEISKRPKSLNYKLQRNKRIVFLFNNNYNEVDAIKCWGQMMQPYLVLTLTLTLNANPKR